MNCQKMARRVCRIFLLAKCVTYISIPDPIDPRFYSPPRASSAATSPISAPGAPPPPPNTAAPVSANDEGTDDAMESARRQTIAERMARLGGIRFGAVPGMPPLRRQTSSPPPASPREEEAPHAQPGDDEEEETAEAQSQRRQAIAARLAGQGRLGRGMFAPPVPVAAPPPPPPRHEAAPTHDSPENRSVGFSSSDDGVKVEAEESSEPEELSHSEVVEEEEAPPPIATRRRSTKPSVAPPPPPPVAAPVRASSRAPSPPISRRSTSPPSRRSTNASQFAPHTPSTDFVIIDTEAPPLPSFPPPPRTTPSRSARSSVGQSQSPPRANDWELPSIPNLPLDFNAEIDLSRSTSSAWSEDSSSYPTSRSPTSTLRREAPRASSPPQVLSGEELQAMWIKIGTQIHGAANMLYQRSRSRSVVGDGSFTGFVQAVLAEVSNISPQIFSEPHSYGYLIHSQNGSTVTRRCPAEILPGDIILFDNCHFQGRKGLQSYSIQIGTPTAEGDDVIGIINEVEGKKHKVKVYHANQHIGGPVSYSTLLVFGVAI